MSRPLLILTIAGLVLSLTGLTLSVLVLIGAA